MRKRDGARRLTSLVLLTALSEAERMKSNIALRSNVYINRTRRKTDPDFLAQVLDYKVLSEEYNERKEPVAPLSLLQREILRKPP